MVQVRSAGLRLGGLVAVLLTVAVVVVGWKQATVQAAAVDGGYAEPAEVVSGAVAVEKEHRGAVTAIGTVLAPRSVGLRNEVSGTIRRVELTPGRIVDAGTLLVALDVSVEEAELRAMQARADLAERSLARLQRLAEQRAIAGMELDAARAEREVALAEMERIRAVIARKTIRAPFRARVGLADVHVGQFLDAGTLLTTLQGVEGGAHIDFAVSEAAAARLQPGEEVDVYGGSDAGATAKARIVAVDARIDPATRNATVRARVDGAAWTPGAAVRVRVPVGASEHVVVVPVSAWRRGPGGDHVFVLEEANGQLRARMRMIRAGAVLGDEFVITDGLRAGERVATAGSFKLRDGALVDVAGGGEQP